MARGGGVGEVATDACERNFHQSGELGAFGQALPSVSNRTRIVIFHATSGLLPGGFFGMLTQGFPQLVRVNADVIRPDPSRSFPERSPVICQVRMVNETPLIPDLECLAQMIAEETSVMPQIQG